MQTWQSRENRSAPFGGWADQLASAFVRLEPSRISTDPFRGSIRQVDAASIQVARVDATAHRVSRLKEHIRLADQDVCFVNLQVEGPGLTRQRGLECPARPCDIVVVDTTDPFEIEHAEDFSLFSISVRKKDVPTAMWNRQAVTLSATEIGREIGATLFGHARLLLRAQEAGLPASPVLAGQLLELIDFAQAFDTGNAPPERRQSARLCVIRDFISRNLTDERLGAGMIGRAVGLSTRYVHKLFESTGESVSEHINALRIEACARDLRKASSQHCNISTIAFRHGYRDLSHFNRRFKRAFGETPTGYRKRHVRTAPAGSR